MGLFCEEDACCGAVDDDVGVVGSIREGLYWKRRERGISLLAEKRSDERAMEGGRRVASSLCCSSFLGSETHLEPFVSLPESREILS